MLKIYEKINRGKQIFTTLRYVFILFKFFFSFSLYFTGALKFKSLLESTFSKCSQSPQVYYKLGVSPARAGIEIL